MNYKAFCRKTYTIFDCLQYNYFFNFITEILIYQLFVAYGNSDKMHLKHANKIICVHPFLPPISPYLQRTKLNIETQPHVNNHAL